MFSWRKLARYILKNKIFLISILFLFTLFLAYQAKNIVYAYTEANLLPDNHPENVHYKKFLKLFGEEANLVMIAVRDDRIFEVKNFRAWRDLAKKIDSFPQVLTTISAANLKELKKDTVAKKFVLKSMDYGAFTIQKSINNFKSKLFNEQPFYENLLFNKKTGTLVTALYLKKDFVNTEKRRNFILKKINPLIQNFENQQNIQIRISGMPYVRTMNSQNIRSEMKYFVLIALVVTAFIFFLFFKSVRATIITLVVVGVGVIWSFGFIGWFGYEVTILTALIPPLLIVIGVPNAIFIINKYQQEIKIHSNKIKALQRVITKVGNATLMTNLTTAMGFATFIFTDSQLLNEFGMIASINIISIFVLALTLIPILYSLLPFPKQKHLKHLDRFWIKNLVKWMVGCVRHHKKTIYVFAFLLIIFSSIGFIKIKISGSILEDMAKQEPFYKDITFFEQELGGIMPVEILVDTKKKNGVTNLKTLRKVEKLQKMIDSIPELSKPISIVNVIKYAKQAFYNGDSSYYKLPTDNEKFFILNYFKNTKIQGDLLGDRIDKQGRYIRITTQMKDVSTPKMEDIKAKLTQRIQNLFPKNRYNVTITGKALVFLKGTDYLIKNLVFSLSLAIVLIAFFMGWTFKSFKMIIISLVPNLLPLLLTGGLMGYLGIPIKPSTILVFSIAFGISVDDTIHFLAKYRQELKQHKNNIKKSVYKALRETGVSMFYTSIVLFFGFLVFTLSNFGGTKALGGLVSITLMFAMTTNLLLLPSLLLSFKKRNYKKYRLNEKILQ